MFCPNCGTQLGVGVNFCPNCGTRVSAVTPVVKTNVTQGNMVMLMGLGDCRRTTAAALLQQICGYGSDEALLIVDSTPITIARELSEAQARFLAQALAEYGLEVSVYDGNGWRDWESANTSVWDSAGSLITGVAAALGLISVNNRITRDMMHRMDYPYRYSGARPPVYRLHTTLRTAPRRVAPASVRPPVHHAPPPPVRPAPAPVRPAPAPVRPAPPPVRPAPAPVRPAPAPVRPAPAPAPARPAPAPARPAPAPSQARPAPGGARPASGGRPGGVPGGAPGGNGRPGGAGRNGGR